jgi:uncharacterized membrane protein
MNKYEFLFKLNQSLENVSQKERQELVKYYDELIQDAIDNGETEDSFIDKLGSVEKITRTIKKDADFVTNVKEKKDYQLQNVFKVSVKVLGWFIFIIIAITLGSIGFSFVTSGAASAVYGGVQLYYAIRDSLSAGTMVMYAGNIALGLGLFLVGIWVFKWLISGSRKELEKLMEFIQSKIKKEGE